MDGVGLREQRVKTVISAATDLPKWMQMGLWPAAIAAGLTVAPAVVMSVALVGWSWWQGWPATRLRNVTLVVAGCCGLAMLTTGDPLWMYHDALAAWDLAMDGSWASAVGHAAGAEFLLSTLVAWWWWHGRVKTMTSGKAMLAGERHMKRQRKHRERTATQRGKSELTPLSRGDRVVLGHRYEETYPEVRLGGEQLSQRHKPWIELSMERIGLHLAVIGETGVGKTTLLERLSGGWTEAAWWNYDQQSSQVLAGSGAGHHQAAPRPLTIMVEAKGGRQAGDQARQWADAMEALGVAPERVGVFPFEQRLNMWRLPAKQLKASLHALAGTDHRFWDSLQRGLLHLVVDGPKHGTPTSSVEFLQRMDEQWLRAEWSGHPVEQQALDAITSSGKGPSSLDADLMLFDDLFRSLGGDFDSGRPLSDFDALYISLPGTVDSVVAAAKASVLIELLAYELSVNARRALFVLDEFSAVSGDTAGAVVNLVERLRSLNGSVIVSSQSYQGLAKGEDERERLLNAMGGGMLVQRTQGPEELSKRSGTRKVSEVGAKLEGNEFSTEGTLRRQDAFLLDPNRLRKLPEHHVAYVLPDEIQWGVVTPMEPTKRTPSKAITGSPQRSLPVAGDATPFLQLRAEQENAVRDQLRGWSQ